MKVTHSISATVRQCRALPSPIALVPTMGALHRGHCALLDKARQIVGPRGSVVASIFVNPTQFGPKEDFSKYPRPFAKDRKLCQEHGVDLLFNPSPRHMYPAGFSTFVDESVASLGLCGASRPGHFRGVCTVVTKLFTIVAPDYAVFGLKDFQQFTVIRRMTEDLNLGVKIVPMATVREADGLALSSRNQYLGSEERAQAPAIRAALLEAHRAFKKGQKNAATLRRIVLAGIAKAPLARVDYVEIVDPQTLKPVKTIGNQGLVAVAAFFGTTRLIDNIWLK